MGGKETDHDEPLFTNQATLLIGLILPKRSRTNKIAFRNNYYGVIKQK